MSLLGLPVFTSFRFHFPRNWFFKDVNQRYIGILRDNIMPYESVADYINSTITNAVIPGIVDEGSFKQFNRIGSSLTYRGSLPQSELKDREITITMTLRGSYMNWVIMYVQMLEYLDWASDQHFMGDVYTQILDYEDNVIIENIYKAVRIVSISSVDLATTELGVLNKNFDVKLGYGDVEVNTKIQNRFL